MNILIAGNGFDLSHYLPTKYDHFMVAMYAIEKWDVSKGEMQFDDLFGSLYEKEGYFFGCTKAIYKTDDIEVSEEQIKELKEKLEQNVWYQYFSDYVKKVKTWIDFEAKIEEALEVFCNFMDEVEKYSKTNNLLDDVIFFLKNKNESEYFLSQKNIRILEIFKIFDGENKFIVDNLDTFKDSLKSDGIVENISGEFIIHHKGYDEFLYKEVANFLTKSLLDFSHIFNFYLKIIDSLERSDDNLNVPILEKINRIYSFNYTSTFERLYNPNIESYFLHGKIGDQPNIVLGVSDLNHQNLRKFNLWGFTKYHQKLFFKTDYKFIEDYLGLNEGLDQEIQLTKEFWLSRSANGQGSVKLIRQKIENILMDNSLDLNFYVWGHSLDYSDSIYIKELFLFNIPYDQNVRIIVYYFNEKTKFDLLANLIHILGKEKVEKWMKKDWLKFEENPDVAKLNNIQPIDLTDLKIVA